MPVKIKRGENNGMLDKGGMGCLDKAWGKKTIDKIANKEGAGEV